MLQKMFSETVGVAEAFLRISLNSRSGSLNRALLGASVTGAPFQVRREDGWAYAAATGDHHPAYNAPDGVAPPLFAVKPLAGPMSRLLLHRELGMNFLRMLHGEQSFTFHRPLRYGQIVVPGAVINGFREVRTGEILDMGLEIRAQHGEKLVSGTSSFFMTTRTREENVRVQATVPRGEEEGAGAPSLAPGAFTRAFETGPRQPLAYASASGDRNPIHVNALAARLAGLPRPIMHGLCMMAMAGREILAEAGAEPGSLRELSLRFSRTAFPGARYLVRGLTGPGGVLEFEVLDSRDRPVLSRGRARLGELTSWVST
ncbi:MAG: MaoC family dehydratase N-terminal domain-containing protein [Deltaproteobacteria bacterium]|nr:MaoC family dehydratase N-terminal domain-containing protein [Deltaproteobacteria bacterium]